MTGMPRLASHARRPALPAAPAGRPPGASLSLLRAPRHRAALLLGGLLLSLLAAGFLTARPAAADAIAPPVTVRHAAVAGPAAAVRAADVAAPASRAAPAVSGPCKLPGLGDVGQLVGLCPAGSGAVGTVTGGCNNAPLPQLPGTGLSGWIETKPTRPPPGGPAFGATASTTEYEQYGYAGVSWSTYGLSCILGTQTDLFQVTDTFIGNMLLGAAKAYVAIDNTVHDWASSPSWLGALNPLVISASRVLHDDLFVIWGGLALLIVAGTVIARSHRGDVAGAITKGAWAVLVLALVGGVLNYPTLAGEATSSLMSQTLNALDAGFTGPGGQANAAASHDSLMVTAVLYDQWLYGEFGTANSQTALQYGPQLFQDQALSWQEAASGPQQIAQIEKNKQTAWGQVASKVQKADPSAYQALQGAQVMRTGVGLLADLLALVTCTFDLYASLVVIMAMLAVLLAVIIFPGLAVVGLHHDMRHWVLGLLSRVAGLLVSGVLYAAASGVDARATILLLTTTAVPRQIAILILALLPIGLWVLLRRVRNKPTLPRAVTMGLGLLGMRHWMRGGTKAGVEQALADSPFFSYFHGGQHQGGPTYVFMGWPGGQPPNGWGAGPGGWVPPAGAGVAAGGGWLPPPAGGGALPPASPGGGPATPGPGGNGAGPGPGPGAPGGNGHGPAAGGGTFSGPAGGTGGTWPGPPSHPGAGPGPAAPGNGSATAGNGSAPTITLHPVPGDPDSFEPWDGGPGANGGRPR